MTRHNHMPSTTLCKCASLSNLSAAGCSYGTCILVDRNHFTVIIGSPQKNANLGMREILLSVSE